MTKTIERLDYSTVGIEGVSPEAVAAAWAEYKANHNPPGMWVGFAGILPDCTEAWTRIGVKTPFAQMELSASRKVVLTDEGSEWRARESLWYRLGSLVVCWRCVFVAQGRKRPPSDAAKLATSVCDDENYY